MRRRWGKSYYLPRCHFLRPVGVSTYTEYVCLMSRLPNLRCGVARGGERVMSTRVQEKDGNAHERGENFVGLELWEFFLVVEEFLGEGSCG